MRTPDKARPDIEFPGRYILDEARFSGGHDRVRSANIHRYSFPEEINT